MRIPLPLRIFAVHLVFMLAIGAVASMLIDRAFRDYEEAWEREIETIPAAKLFSPLAAELARSLLLRLEQGPSEPREQVRASVAAGLDEIFPGLPSIERLIILDPDLEVQYANELAPLQLSFAEDGYTELLPTAEPVRREILLRSGDRVTEVLLPVFGTDVTESGESEKRRLGSVLIHYRRDSRLEARLGETYPDELGTEGGSTAAVERLFNPWASEVARGLLRELEIPEEQRRERFQISVSDGLNKVIGALPMEKLIIVDQERRIQYINDSRYLDLVYTEKEYADLFSSETVMRRRVTLSSGERGEAVMLPVFERPAASGDGERRRLGSVLIHYRPDPELLQRMPQLRPPSVGFRDYLQPLLLFLVLAVGSGILLAALTGFPVRRMERLLEDFRSRGFRGGLDPGKSGVPSYLAPTFQTISEMGGQLEALDAQGREREALLETLSQSLEDGMIAVDPRGIPVAWNPAARRLLIGGEPTEATEAAESSGEADLLAAALERNPDLRFAMDREDSGRTREVELTDPEGGKVPARLTRVPLELRPGVTGTLLLIRDLGALRKVESHLLDAGRFAILAHLAAGMAHEIRNPLHAIQINAGVVEQYAGTAGDDKTRQAIGDSLTTIKDEAQRLTDLLNNYLGMVRHGDDSGPVDVYDLSRRVIQLVDYAARKSKVEIRLEGEEHPPVVLGVANRLQQAVLNLVLNAIQAMPGGGVVTLKVVPSGNVVRLTVSDTGPGLPQELSDQLFDTRVTTKAGGSGLGLPLVRMITEAHGGGVWYRSNPGEGASFTLVLPVPQEVSRA